VGPSPEPPPQPAKTRAVAIVARVNVCFIPLIPSNYAARQKEAYTFQPIGFVINQLYLTGSPMIDVIRIINVIYATICTERSKANNVLLALSS
jgi:hypothetical protein